MRILFIIDSLRSGGKERRLVQLLKGLKERNFLDAEIIVLNKNIHYKEVFELEIPIHYLKRNFFRDIKIFSRFYRICKNFKPDIVHCWDDISAFHFAPLCKLKGIKFISSMISAAPPMLSIFSKYYIANALSYPFSDVILSNSAAGLKSFRVPRKKSKFIHNGFDFRRIENLQPPITIKDNFGIKSKFVIGMVASFSEKKDHDTLIEAGLLIVQNRDDVCFVAVGAGVNLTKIHRKIGDNNNGNFIFTGKQKDVESIINIFDIGVLSTFTEGISNSIMEYMALKKPVIATKGGGTSELVIDGETGFLIEPKNPGQLAEKIEYLLLNPEIALRMGNKGKERIVREFNLKKMVDETYNLYNEVLGIK